MFISVEMVVDHERAAMGPADPLTTSERKIMFREVGKRSRDRERWGGGSQFHYIIMVIFFNQRLRQIASRKKEPSAFECIRANFLDKLLCVLR